MQTRRRGRVQFTVDMFTEEEHKKILQLIDPGFNRLSIRKEKNEAQMLPYINKSRKKYRFLIGWFQAANSEQHQLLRELAEEAVEKKKVFGWQNDHVKIHMMSVRQLATIPKFVIPARVTSKEAAQALRDDRMVFVMQYPDKLYEYRQLYKPFDSIVCIKGEEYPVNIPQPVQESHGVPDYYHNYTVPTIEPLNKPSLPAVKQPEVVYESWGPPEPQQSMSVMQQVQQQSGLPPRVNQLRMKIGFGNFSPIVSESEDAQDDNK